MRHLQAWRMGERLDEESGYPHLYHVATNMMFLEYFDTEEDFLDEDWELGRAYESDCMEDDY